VADIDGNMFLDVFNSIACISLGYNHPDIVKVSKSDLMSKIVTNRSALGINPPKEYVDLV